MRGLGAGLPRLLLDGRELPATALRRGATACGSAWTAVASGPLWLEQGGAAAIRYG